MESKFDIIYSLVFFLIIQGRGVEGVNEPISFSGGDYVGQTALVGLENRGPPPESPINAASLSFCDMFVLTRKAAIGLLSTLNPELRREWLSVTSHHAENIASDRVSLEEGSNQPVVDILAVKIGELKRKELEVSALRDEVLTLLGSRAMDLTS